MRIAVVIRSNVFNVFYRALGPVSALRARGHEMVAVEMGTSGSVDMDRLLTCDVVHVYRCADPALLACIDRLHRRGIAVTWDNDDDIRRLPPESPIYKKVRGEAAKRDFRAQVNVMRRVDIVTTPSPVLAATYRDAGAPEVVHIENYLLPEQFTRAPRRHAGLVIGWVAALEHRAEDRALDISGSLTRVMERHPDVRVETIGVELPLDPTRYSHTEGVAFLELRDRLRQFDIGIAPLSDIPMNYARSNVKVKEYAAVGVPWLASARGPYEGLGQQHGGMLVPDDGWDEALETLVPSRLKRWRLGRQASRWGKDQHVARNLDRWEQTFERAISLAREPRAAPAAATAVR